MEIDGCKRLGASKLGRCKLGLGKSYLGRLSRVNSVGIFVRGRKTRLKSKRSSHLSYAAYSVKIICRIGPTEFFRPCTKVPTEFTWTKFSQTEFASTEFAYTQKTGYSSQLCSCGWEGVFLWMGGCVFTACSVLMDHGSITSNDCNV